MVIDIQIRNYPNLSTRITPVPREGVVLAVPDSLVRTVIEKVDRRIVSLPIDQFRISLHELVNGVFCDLQEPGWHTIGIDTAIGTNNRPAIRMGIHAAHIFLFILFESISAGDYIALSLYQSEQVLRIETQIIIQIDNNVRLGVQRPARHGRSCRRDVWIAYALRIALFPACASDQRDRCFQRGDIGSRWSST